MSCGRPIRTHLRLVDAGIRLILRVVWLLLPLEELLWAPRLVLLWVGEVIWLERWLLPFWKGIRDWVIVMMMMKGMMIRIGISAGGAFMELANFAVWPFRMLLTRPFFFFSSLYNRNNTSLHVL
jgi:hypothetical protein